MQVLVCGATVWALGVHMLEKPYWPLGDRTETCTCEVVYKSLTATRVTSYKWGQRAQGQQSRGVRWAGWSSLYWGQGFASLFLASPRLVT